MNGIDISSYQSGLNLNSVAIDFAIIKATEGTSYVNPICDMHFQEGLAKGIKLGVYHFASYTDPRAEAEYFYNNTTGYVGKAIFVLDNEGSGKFDVAWNKAFLDRFYELSGVKPLIYMSESVVNGADWSSVINGDYGLWVAKYADMIPDNGFGADKGTDFNVNWGAAGAALWQWTSRGRLNGYNGDLDFDIFYGNQATWDAYARPVASTTTTTTKPAATTTTTTEAQTTTATTLLPKPTTTTTIVPTITTTTKSTTITQQPKPTFDEAYSAIQIGEPTMTLQIPAWVRAVLYIITALGTPVVAYLNVRGVIGSDAVALWSAEVTVVSVLAALKTTSQGENNG